MLRASRRREVEFDSALRDLTERAIADLHALVDSLTVPPAVFKPTCEECSLFEVCLPKATSSESRTSRLIRQLFEI
jgi:CRISPR-associated exonuclease Cas4